MKKIDIIMDNNAGIFNNQLKMELNKKKFETNITKWN